MYKVSETLAHEFAKAVTSSVLLFGLLRLATVPGAASRQMFTLFAMALEEMV